MRNTLLAVLLVLPLAVLPAAAQSAGEDAGQGVDELRARIAELPPRYRDWVVSVIGLLSQRELDYFLALTADYRRDAFMKAFWEPRDPDPRTPQNELYERWDQYVRQAGGFPYGDPRSLLYLLNGPPTGWTLPDGRPVTRCFSTSRELEIWFYEGSERTERRFAVILFRRSNEAPYETYLPGQSVRPIQRTGRLPVEDVRLLCADELAGWVASELSRIAGYDRLLEQVLTPPLPSSEWLANFQSSVADLPPGAETFDAGFEVAFPARNQSRTALRVILTVPRESSPGRRFDGVLFHDFLMIGEVIKDGQLFESFNYRFEGPTPEDAEVIPLGFTRYLRSGEIKLRLLLRDVYADRYAHVERVLEVPSPEGLPAVADADPGERPEGPVLRLQTPSGNVHAGKVRFRASAVGEIDKVTFYLDGEPVFSKRSPPYSVELDLGEEPLPHRVRVVGFFDDREVATDQVWLNQGAERFRVRLVEPRSGGIYPGSFTARVEVTTPAGLPPTHLELYLNDELVGTLTEPPFAKVLGLAGEAAVVRAVAYLDDGTTAEDAVLVNATGFEEEVRVRLVEVPVVVRGADGRPLTGLGRDVFRLTDGGVPRKVEGFEEAADAPLRTVLLIDRSASMAEHLERVVGAARAFSVAALQSADDRLAVLSFADQVTVDTGFTASSGQVERALAGLVASGGTALYDSVVQALNTFEEVAGQGALVLFSDGRDESSRLDFEQLLATVRRAGVSVYAVALAEAFPEKRDRRPLEELAGESGGRAFFLDGLDGLDAAYLEVMTELRSRYLLSFTPPAGEVEGAYRPLAVEVDVPGAEVRTRRGYLP